VNQIRFGIDLGGSKIEIIALDDSLKSGEKNVVYQKRIETPKGDYAATLAAISELVLEAEATLSQTGSVGIGIPGAISHKTGKIKNANSTYLIGQDLQADLQNLLNRPIALANDANCFALSEAIEGSAQGSDVVFGVIIGTGCGGGVVVNAQILNGINAIGGEWGHNPLPWLERDELQLPCYCGLKGCNETFLSGSGLEAHYASRLAKSMKLSKSPGLVKTAKQIVELSQQGDDLAQKIMQDYTVWLAKGLASVINVLDPDVIVLGGGLSNIQSLYSDIPQIWGQWVFSDQVNTRLVAPRFGDASGVRGAAWL
jgi:fructokinase